MVVAVHKNASHKLASPSPDLIRCLTWEIRQRWSSAEKCSRQGLAVEAQHKLLRAIMGTQ